MASTVVEVLAGWGLPPRLEDLPRRLRVLGLRSVRVLHDLLGSDPLSFFAEVLELEDGFDETEKEILHKFVAIVATRASLEKRTAESETHLDVFLECLKRKAQETPEDKATVAPLPGLRAAAAFRRMGPGARETIADRDRRERTKWAKRFREVLVGAEAPVLVGLGDDEVDE